MDNPTIWISALAPGFAGLAVLKLLNGDATDGAIQQNILKYFLFASTALLIADAVMGFQGPLSKIWQHAALTLWDSLIPLVIAVLIAVFWHVTGSKLAITLANQINKAAGKNPVFLQQNLLGKILNDGKPHFLDIQFPDGSRQKGYVSSVIVSKGSLILRPEPAWTKNYTRQDIQRLIELRSGLVITEYTFK